VAGGTAGGYGLLLLLVLLTGAIAFGLRRRPRRSSWQRKPTRRPPGRPTPPRRAHSACATGKMAYANLGDAWAAVHANQERYERGQVGYRLVRPYECDWCGQVHNTSKPLRF
jgi:hypothetical protein